MDENDPVNQDEFVFRRIHRSFFDPSLPIPVLFPAFRPNQNDGAGISLFRELFVRPEGTLANVDAAKRGDYYVARLAVQSLLQLSLSVRPDPIPGGPLGHVVIPELTWPDYVAGKPRWRPTILELAKLASAAIVLAPS